MAEPGRVELFVLNISLAPSVAHAWQEMNLKARVVACCSDVDHPFGTADRASSVS